SVDHRSCGFFDIRTGTTESQPSCKRANAVRSLRPGSSLHRSKKLTLQKLSFVIRNIVRGDRDLLSIAFQDAAALNNSRSERALLPETLSQEGATMAICFATSPAATYHSCSTSMSD